MKSAKIKVYFYQGFEAPELMASFWSELQKLQISDTYQGELTVELQSCIRECRDIDELKDELGYYGLFVNPTKADFIDANRSWFPSNELETHLDDWTDDVIVH